MVDFGRYEGAPEDEECLREGGACPLHLDNQLTVAQKLLGSIKKKMTKNKYTLWGTLLLLAAVVIFVIYTYIA